MIQRECPLCDSELVRVKRADQQQVSGSAQEVAPGWRCGVCGGEFTTEQVRDGKSVKSTENRALIG
jgi:uncharacterized protein with PIN domain